MQLCSTHVLLIWRSHAALGCRNIPAMFWASVQLQRNHFTLFFSVGAKAENALTGIIAVSHRWAISVRWESQRPTCFKTLIQLIQIKQQTADCCLLSWSNWAANVCHGRCQKHFFPEWGHATSVVWNHAGPASGTAPCDFREPGLRDRNAAGLQGSRAAEVAAAPNSCPGLSKQEKNPSPPHTQKNTIHGLQGGRAGIFRCLCSPLCLCGRRTLPYLTDPFRQGFWSLGKLKIPVSTKLSTEENRSRGENIAIVLVSIYSCIIITIIECLYGL